MFFFLWGGEGVGWGGWGELGLKLRFPEGPPSLKHYVLQAGALTISPLGIVFFCLLIFVLHKTFIFVYINPKRILNILFLLRF